MSTSPTSTRFALSVEALCSTLSLSSTGASRPSGGFGGPSGNALLSGPSSRAAIVYRMPVALNPFKSSLGSGRNWKRMTGKISASVLDWSSGVSLLVAPSADLK